MKETEPKTRPQILVIDPYLIDIEEVKEKLKDEDIHIFKIKEPAQGRGLIDKAIQFIS